MFPSRSPTVLLALAVLVGITGCAERHAVLVMERAVSAHERGDRVLAARGYREALRLDPSARGAYQNLSVLALEAGRAEDAIVLATREVERHSEEVTPRLNLAVLLARAGRSEETAAVLGHGSVPPDAAGLILAEAARRAGNAPRARERLESLLQGGGDGVQVVERTVRAAQVRRAMAWLAASMGAWDVVGRELAAVDTMRTPADARLQALASSLQGDLAGALAAMEGQEGAVADAMRAHWHAASGRTEEASQALSELDTAGLSVPSLVAVHHLRARLALQEGELAAALKSLDGALGLVDAGQVELLLDRALLLAHLGQEARALEVVASVLASAAAHPRAVKLRELLTGSPR